MAYDEGLAERVRLALQELPALVEKKMFIVGCIMG